MLRLMILNDLLIPFEKISQNDLNIVGGKNSSLGEMISNLSNVGVTVPTGYATTVKAFQDFIKKNGLDKKINDILNHLDVNNIESLQKSGMQIRSLINDGEFSSDFKEAINFAYEDLKNRFGNEISLAVRSSATAEDLPDASFAGQQETFLNITGIENIIKKIKEVFASLYNDRAISYRVHKGFHHSDVSISVGLQLMVRSDLAASGVMFTIDTESGYDGVILITSSYGLGESVVQGQVNPDEFVLFKDSLNKKNFPIIRKNIGSKALKMIFSSDQNEPVKYIQTKDEESKNFSINDDQCTELGKMALLIEKHYKKPMDIEWGIDGISGQIFILQARPETVSSQEDKNQRLQFKIKNKGDLLISGRSIGNKIGVGKVSILQSINDMNLLQDGDILVTDMTDPDWEPIMKKASAIVTNRGGRTCHAAIIARELGIPAVVGTGNSTKVLSDKETVSVSCCEGDTGYVYDGKMDYEKIVINKSYTKPSNLKVMMNVGNPDLAFQFQKIPNDGVGLARLEFIINKNIGIHPKAILQIDKLHGETKNKILESIRGYPTPKDFYISKLSEGIATIASAFHPKPVIVRLSDFKSNEYSSLVGGSTFEPVEENPMLGFRGVSRYLSEDFKECFEMECDAIKIVRNKIGLDNVQIMVPFVRTINEAEQVINLLSQNGLKSGSKNLKIIMMCELPTNSILAHKFINFFDGFSIGSNDMTQLTLGLDRDSGIVSEQFDERDESVKYLLELAINACKKREKYIGICGQGPSDHLDFAQWLMEKNIDSISLNPDTVLDTLDNIKNN